jgi:hypothetical protein
MNVLMSIKSLLPLVTPRVRYAVGAVAAAGAVVALAARSGDPARALPPTEPGAPVAMVTPKPLAAEAVPSPVAPPVVSPASPLLNRARSDGAMPTDYAILMQRSMFSHRRGKFTSDDDAPPEPPRERRPEAGLILRGISDENGTFKAFVEDVRESRIARLTAGQPIGRGHVAEISFAGLRYQTPSGRVTDVAIGCTFDGVATAAASTQPTTQPGAPLGIDGGGDRKLRRKGMSRSGADASAADAGGSERQIVSNGAGPLGR